MIRDGCISDLPKLFELGNRLHEQTPYRNVPIDREMSTRTYGQCLSSALGFAKVAVKDEQVSGVLLGMVDRLWWSRSRYATDLLFYCEDGFSGLALLRAFLDWAWSTPGVVDVTCGVSSGLKVDRIGVLYRRAGFREVGGLWIATK